MPTSADRSRRRRHRDVGFSLMEVVVSLGVFAVIATAGAGSLIKTMNTSADNRERVRAASLADQEIERTRAQLSVARPAVTNVNLAEVPDAEGFTVVREVTWLPAITNGPAGYNVPGSVLLVEVRVSWKSLKPTRPAVINTTVLS